MAETESIDIMASVFENIVLPDVQVQHNVNHQRRDSQISHQSSNKAPVPKQRHDIAHHHSSNDEVPILEREREFRASFLGSEHLDEPPHLIERQSIKSQSHDAASLKSASTRKSSVTSHTKSASRHESTISRKSEPIYDDVHESVVHHEELHTPTFEYHNHEEIIVESHTPTFEHYHNHEEVIVESHTPTFEHHHNHEEVIVEPHTPTHEHHHIESDRISNSSKLPKRTSNTEQLLAELRSRQINGAEADHGGTISTSKTSELANEYELYATPVPKSEGTEVNEQTDDSGTEVEEVLPVNRTKYLFDTKDPYRIEHDKQPDTFQQELGQKVVGYQRNELNGLDASNTLRSNASAASDFIVSIFENKTQDRVRNEVGSEIKLNNLRKLFESPVPSLNGTPIEDNPQQKHASYKQFLGQKSPEHRVFRSGSVISMVPPPLIDPTKEPVDHFDQNHQLFSQYKHFYTGQKPTIPLQKAFVHKPAQLNGHGKPHLTHHSSHVHHHHNNVNHDESRRSTLVEPNHHNNVKTPHESRRSTLIEHHQNLKTPESRRSTLIEHHQNLKTPESKHSTLLEHHQNLEHDKQESKYSIPVKKTKPSYQQYLKETNENRHYEVIVEEPVHHHHHHNNVKTPHESRRASIEHHLSHDNHSITHDNHFITHDNHSISQNHVKTTPSYHKHVKSSEDEHIYEEIGGKVEPNNNVEHVPVSKLCSIFESGFQKHHKHKHFISAPVSPAQNYHHHTENFRELEKHVPLLSRVVISDETAQGKGSCTPGSIAALHKSILAGNPIIQTRSITPIIELTSVHEDISVAKEEAPIHAVVEKRHRKPKTLAAFYDRWGKLPTIPSEI